MGETQKANRNPNPNLKNIEFRFVCLFLFLSFFFFNLTCSRAVLQGVRSCQFYYMLAETT